MKRISPDEARKSSPYLRLAESREWLADKLRSDAEQSAREGDLIMRTILLRDAENAARAAATFRESHEKRVSDIKVGSKSATDVS